MHEMPAMPANDPLAPVAEPVNPLILGLASMLAQRVIAKAKAASDQCVAAVALAGPLVVLASESLMRHA